MLALFLTSAVLTALTAIIALFGDAGPASPVVFWLIGINFALTFFLAGATLWRMRSLIFPTRIGEPAPKLHRRFVMLFSLAAVVPAVLIALFFGGFLTRGLETWFGERVEASVESSADTARFYLDQIIEQTQIDMAATAADLNQQNVRDALQTSPDAFQAFLEGQARLRAFTAAYLVDSNGDILASAESQVAPDFRAPSQEDFRNAQDDILIRTNEAERQISALFDLEAYPDAYLYALPDVNKSLFDALLGAQAAINDFRTARSQRGRIQLFFLLIYAQATLLVLAGAVWLGLASAGRVVTPVGKLVHAADQIRRGDLTARVNVGVQQDELAALARAFNRMTRQLQEQRHDLIASNDESDARRRLIEAVLSGVSAGVMSIDAHGVVTLANSSAKELLGQEKDGLVGRKLAEVAPQLNDLAVRAGERGRDMAEAQIELISEDGSVITLNARAAADTASSGGVVITFDDISRLITAQRNAAWRDVARRIAHEIKNPLTPIQLSAERLKRRFRPAEEGKDTEIFDNCTDTIIRQVNDIGRMVNEFSSFARMPTPHVEPASLQALAKEAAFARRVASPGVKVELEAPDEEIMVLCDERLASQALANVLKNASESVAARLELGEGPKNGWLVVRLSKADGMGCIEVEDNGLGWPEGARERLTEPYMTTREKGTGLGLAIVKRVMEDHSGALELDEPESGGRGAVVRLNFPLADSRTQATAAGEAAAV